MRAKNKTICSFRLLVYIFISTRLASHMRDRVIEQQKSFSEKAELWGKQKQTLLTSPALPYQVPCSPSSQTGLLTISGTHEDICCLRAFAHVFLLAKMLCPRILAWLAVLSLVWRRFHPILQNFPHYPVCFLYHIWQSAFALFICFYFTL